jgi:hypothetical protein
MPSYIVTVINFCHLKYYKLILLLVPLLVSCTAIINPKERNELTFEDKIDNVYDSIGAMNSLLNKCISKNFAIAIDKNELYLIDNRGSQKIGNLTDSLFYLNDSINFVQKKDQKRFLKLSDYLNTNHLERWDIDNYKVEFCYRSDIYMADHQTDLNRIVLIVDSVNLDLMHYKILDRYKNLYLLANKEAEIFEGRKP